MATVIINSISVKPALSRRRVGGWWEAGITRTSAVDWTAPTKAPTLETRHQGHGFWRLITFGYRSPAPALEGSAACRAGNSSCRKNGASAVRVAANPNFGLAALGLSPLAGAGLALLALPALLGLLALLALLV